MSEQRTSRRDFLRWLSISGAGLAAAGVLPGAFAHAAEPDVTVITHATLIDGTGARPLRDATVVLIGDRIVWAGAHHAARVPEGARIVDARGKYVIPGLWDMHTHGTVYEDIFVPLYLVNGVTGVREMWGYPEVQAVRERIDRGELLGPRIVMASSIIDGPITLLGPPVVKVGTEAEAREAVRAAKAAKADFVKVYSYLGANEVRAIADETRRQGMPFAGHVAYRLSTAEASDLGQRSFEHFFDVPISLSAREAEFRRILAGTPYDPANPRAFFNLSRELDRQATFSFSPAKVEAFVARQNRNSSWQSPTLAVNRVMSSPADTYAHDPRLRYMPAWIHDFWREGVKGVAPVTPEQIAQQREFLAARLRMLGALHHAGIGVIGGTDCLNPYVFPGFSSHDELELLVEAGLSPLQAIQTMTRDAARYLGFERTMGTVTAGKVADLVLLDANPLADIRNTQKIHAVVTKGRLITAEQRLRMLADVEAAANKPPAPSALTHLTTLPTCCNGA
ncbi:amidohydrolase family protein [Amycolatopsis anabasis]|uniref:amidohydrolase family protein n=1 Tax=Amycolatopsis anabasis TaxID=1840409 RepID=UPI00131B1F0F|nr:amidohydrolase family protein [Amycolatopsis anabasis]